MVSYGTDNGSEMVSYGTDNGSQMVSYGTDNSSEMVSFFYWLWLRGCSAILILLDDVFMNLGQKSSLTMLGFEPMTPRLQVQRSTNWAMLPHLQMYSNISLL